mgnify:FL=1
MKVTFTSTEPDEILRIVKSEDMAMFIWELVHNVWRQFENEDMSHVWDAIHEKLDEFGIEIDDLIN